MKKNHPTLEQSPRFGLLMRFEKGTNKGETLLKEKPILIHESAYQCLLRKGGPLSLQLLEPKALGEGLPSEK